MVEVGMIRPETIGTPARRFSGAEREEIRRRLAAGERHKDIAAAVGASTKAVQRLIYADHKPPPAWLFSSESRLTLSDREEISRGLQAGLSLRAIARTLKRAPSTIARDVALNGGRSTYRAWRATRAAERRSKRPKPRKLLIHEALRFVMLLSLPNGRTAASVNAALIKRIQQLPEVLKRSLTWDRGAELAEHKLFTVATGVQVYVCDPQSPWQRGSNENTNGLLRQYLPRSMDFSTVTQAELDAIAEQLNMRPRKTLDWSTPAQSLAKVLQ